MASIFDQAFGLPDAELIPGSTPQDPPLLPPAVTQAIPPEAVKGPAPSPAAPFVPDQSLLEAQIRQESGGNPLAVNAKSGAQGLVQIMPQTAANPGFGVDPVHDPFNPDEARRFQKQYMGALLSRYNGNETAALAAYNWGPGHVD